MDHLGDRLKHERKKRLFSQEDCATHLGVDARTIRRWESGAAIPQPYYRRGLCDLYNIDPEELCSLIEHHTAQSQGQPQDSASEASAPVEKRSDRSGASSLIIFLISFALVGLLIWFLWHP